MTSLIGQNAAPLLPDELESVARVKVRTGSTELARRALRLIGSGISIALVDDTVNEEVEITLSFTADMATQAELDDHNADTTAVHGIADTSVLVEDASLAATLAARQSLRTDELFHIRDEKAANTAGGTFTSGAWRTRTLNTTGTNTITGASLASNQITLPAGTYWIEAAAPAFDCHIHKAKLRNTTDSTDALIGTSDWVADGDQTQTRSIVQGLITIAAQKVFELQHQCLTTKASTGFGVASNFGVVEVYSEIKIWKVA